MLLQARAPASESVNFANLTRRILDEVSGLEDSVHALIDEKNVLSEADSSQVEQMDNLYEDLDTEGAGSEDELSFDEKNRLSVADSQDIAHLDNLDTEGAGPEGLQLALQVGKQSEGGLLQTKTERTPEEKPTARKTEGQRSTPSKKHSARETNRTAELQSKQSSTEEIIGKRRLKLTVRKAVEEKEEQDQQEKDDDVHSKVAANEELRVSSPEKLDYHKLPLSNLTGGIDSKVTSLEKDLYYLRTTRRQACSASKQTLTRLEVIVGVLSTMKCS
jgi:hypothetical protein